MKMSGTSKKNFLRSVNPHLICPLCRGYLIDATTVVECLHSFCRTCILKYLKSESRCPSCKDALNKAKPNIKADNTLQDIVYKLVPGLYHKEMKRRKEFYMKHPEHADSATPEQRGEDASSRLFFAPEDAISLSLEYLPSGVDPVYVMNVGESEASLTNANYPKSDLDGGPNRRYLQCPALVTIAHLKKFLANKYNIDVTRFNIEICQKRAALPDYMTLMDVAYIYAWKRNAPMRFFYIITQHEHFLEAPPNDRPSTPGLGASFPPNDEIKQEKKEVKETIKKHTIKKVNKEETSTVKSDHETESKFIVKDSEKAEKTRKIAPKPESDKPNIEASVENEKKTVKTPIKILKTSNGSYQVQKSTKTSSNVEQASNPEFSVVSVDDGKIKLKQCSPNVSSKPKVISNVVFRNPDRGEKPLILKEEKHEKKKMEKTKRKVTFVDESAAPEIKKVKDQPDKNQFLQSFQLQLKDTKVEVKPPQVSPKLETKPPESPKMNNVKIEMKPSNSPKAKVVEEETKYSNNSSVKVKLEEKLNLTSNSQESPKKPVATASSANIDVYAFPNEPPQIMPGAVKRKCPPGLMITDVPASKRMALPSPNSKKPVPSLMNTAKSYRKLMNKPTNPLPLSPGKPPMTSETRSLLDECGLNIPAGLSITLTSPRHSSSFPCFDDDLSDKVSPNISLNNKSLDSQVLKAFKMGQVVSNAKQKKEQNVLDLTKTPKIKIPKPPKKASPGSRTKQPHFDSQVVTLMGGQKYYRAPPGSLTPAAHRVSEFLMPPSRPPVYAPSCLGSPPQNFPKFESLYVLNQSPTLHQFQMDKFKMMQDNPKSHLVTQCPPTKPTRSSQASLAIPIPKQSTNGMSPSKKCTAQKPSRMVKNPPVLPKPIVPSMNPYSSMSTSSPSSDQNSPRVSSTVSPSPPPTSSGVSEDKKQDSKKSTEVIKSPESPDSSSTIPEKEANEKSAGSEGLEKSFDKEKTEEKNTIFQERLLAAFPSREWDKNPKAAEHFGNLIKSLSDKESEEKSKAEKNVVPVVAQVVE